MSTVQERLQAVLAALSPGEQETLLSFGEFLASRGGQPLAIPSASAPAVPAEPREIPDPKDIPRPESEKVVAAIKRLSQTYFMLDKSKMLGYTSDLMTQHIIHGRDGVEVIDELESVFRREYEKLKPE